MTIKIHSDKLVPIPSLSKQAGKSGPSKDGVQQSGNGSRDKVVLSSFVREMHQSREAQPGQDTERAQRVAELKQQVADGSYQPNLEDVAESLLKYIMKDRSDG